MPTKASQMISLGTAERQAKLLRAWHLAILRFAVTRDNADRLGVLAIANEIDRLGQQHRTGEGFSFFRRTGAELCAAMLRRQDSDDALLSRYLTQIDDVPLHRALAAALDIRPRKPDLAKTRPEPKQDLWRGLPSRRVAEP
jgi:hypothetical protein